MPKTNIKPIPIMTPEQIAKFWSFVDIRSVGECWEWMRCRSRYGRFNIGPIEYKTHRIAFYLTYGRDPELLICHTCDNPPCCNPGHLFEGTNADNIRDCVRKGRIFRGQKGAHGEAHGRAILNWKTVAEIRTKYAAGDRSIVSLAAEYGVCKSTIGYVVNHAIWRTHTL